MALEQDDSRESAISAYLTNRLMELSSSFEASNSQQTDNCNSRKNDNEAVNTTSQEVAQLLSDLQDFTLRDAASTAHGTQDAISNDASMGGDDTAETTHDEETNNPLEPQQTQPTTLTNAMVDASLTCDVCKQRLQEINALLSAAQAERQQAREWAHQVRTKTNQWVALQQRQQSGQSNNQKHILNKLISIVRQQHIRMIELETALKRHESLLLFQQQPGSGTEGVEEQEDLRRTPFRTPPATDAPLQPPPTVSPSHSESHRRDLPQSPRHRKPPRRVVTTQHNNRQVIQYSSGAVREIFQDQQVITFPNGDIQTIDNDTNDTVSYYYRASNILQVQHDDHVQYRFGNGQVEEHYDHKKVVHYSDGTTREYSTKNVSFAVTV